MAIVGSSLVSKNNNIHFSVTDTLRNQPVDVNSYDCDFIIDIDGTIRQNRTSTPNQAYVLFVGGNDTFINEKEYREPRFYLTERQKVTLYSILREMAVRTDAAQITSDVEALQQIAYATYFNYCG